MKSGKIRSELFSALDKPNAWQCLRLLMLKLKNEDSEIVLDALLGVFFENSDPIYAGQFAAGGLLWKLKPTYRRDLREDIKHSLENWDVSVEELPWYFAEVMGIDKVRAEVQSLLAEPLNDVSRRKAGTYLYWLSVSTPEEFRAKLNQEWNGRLRG